MLFFEIGESDAFLSFSRCDWWFLSYFDSFCKKKIQKGTTFGPSYTRPAPFRIPRPRRFVVSGHSPQIGTQLTVLAAIGCIVAFQLCKYDPRYINSTSFRQHSLNARSSSNFEKNVCISMIFFFNKIMENVCSAEPTQVGGSAHFVTMISNALWVPMCQRMRF